MPSRTQIVCLCEGERGSIDAVFINKLMRLLKPKWVRPDGNNFVRLTPCGGRTSLVEETPGELRSCLDAGADTTLMVWADCDHDCANGEHLKTIFWNEAQREGITRQQFDQIVFVFAKDRLENWVEFLNTGNTDEASEGPRVKYDRQVADAAKKLADLCKTGKPLDGMPPSLQWSCKNWRTLVERMR